jgi:Protein of unknown function (DUF2793)
MAITAHMGLTLVEQAQAQKEVTVNEALQRIDAVLNNGALQVGLNTPPVTPLNGDVYIVGTSATGAWTGQNKAIAYYDQIWRFISPKAGSTLWVQNLASFYVYNGTDWVVATPAVSGNYQSMIEVQASDMRPLLTGGCATLAQVAMGASKPDILTLDFDANVQEYSVFSVSMPYAWNLGNVTAQVLWSHGAAAASFGVVWSLQSLARADGDFLNISYGASTSQTDTGGTADRLYISPITTAIVPSGTATAGNAILFRISRFATSASDTLAVDARLHSVRIFYSVTGLSNA